MLRLNREHKYNHVGKEENQIKIPIAGEEEGEGEEEPAGFEAEGCDFGRLDDRFFRGTSTHELSSPFRTHLVHGRKESQPAIKLRFQAPSSVSKPETTNQSFVSGSSDTHSSLVFA